MEKDISETLVKTLGLQFAFADVQDVMENGVVYRGFVSHLWTIVIEDQLVLAGTKVVVSSPEMTINKTAMWLRYRRDRQHLDASRTLVMRLETEDDPVEKMLHTMNIMPEFAGLSLGSHRNYQFEVFTSTFLGEAYFKYRGLPETNNMKAFWRAVVERARMLAGTFRDDDIDEFLRYVYVL